MKRWTALNLGTIIMAIVIFCFAYYILLQDNFLHLSIAAIIARSHCLETTKHLLVVALLPIYIALVVFGSAMLSYFLGSSLQQVFTRAIKRLSLY